MASLASERHEFFKTHKGELEMRLGVLAPLLIELERFSVISSIEREEVQCHPTSCQKNHALIVMLERKGARAQGKFYEALQVHDPLLVEDLQHSGMSPAVPEPQQGGVSKKVSLKRKLQAHLKNRFSTVHQEFGDRRVQDIYTELYIVEGRTGGVTSDHEISTIDMSQIGNRPNSDDEQVKLQSIFTAKSATKVLTLGIAGVGKTIAVQKFVMDWVEEKANQDIDFIFVLPFRELNLKKEKGHYSLFDLLLLFHHGLEDLKNFPEFTECKILFILDGLDESRLELEFKSEAKQFISEPGKKSSVDILISSVIEGILLPSTLIWVTTRPAAASLIPRDCFNLVTEVRGFSDDQKDAFFRKNTQHSTLNTQEAAERAERIIAHIKRNRSLYIMCHIPVFCRIVATVVDKLLEERGEEGAGKTLTEVYTLYSVSQIKRMNDKYLDQDKKTTCQEKGQFLIKLGKLAFQHLDKGSLIFYEKDLKECDIEVESGALKAGVCTQIFNIESATTGENIFSFVHLSVQEFLAALYVLYKNATCYCGNRIVNTWRKLTHWLSASRFDLYTLAVDKALQSQNGHLDLFVRFLLGLAPMLEPKIYSTLNLVLPQLAIREESITKTVQYIKKRISEDLSPERIINLFHCLNELGDSSLTEEISRYMSSADEENDLTPAQCSALAYLLLMSAEDFEELDLKKYLRSEERLHRMLPVLKVTRRVRLNQCHLSKASCGIMASALQNTPSHLRELDMSDNDLQDEGVDLLCVGLRDPQCKLETLRLNRCHLSKASCEMMASVLPKRPSHLRELDLSDNDLLDAGVELLCVGLRNPQCKLEILRLSGCLITYKGCSFLASALKSNPSYLKELDLSYNHPGDSGVRELTDRLHDLSCKLETFRCDHKGECRMKPGPRKYACELTMDPNTARRCLSLSEGNRKVTWEKTEQPYPDQPERFDYRSQMLCSEGLSGRCYWEAEWSGDRAEIAVAYRSIKRKGGNDDSWFGCNAKSWRLDCLSNSHSAWHNKKETALDFPSSLSRRVGVYLDLPAGTLSFYSVSSDKFTHLHTFHSTFATTEHLYPGFGFEYCVSESSVSLCQIT